MQGELSTRIWPNSKFNASEENYEMAPQVNILWGARLIYNTGKITRSFHKKIFSIQYTCARYATYVFFNQRF